MSDRDNYLLTVTTYSGTDQNFSKKLAQYGFWYPTQDKLSAAVKRVKHTLCPCILAVSGARMKFNQIIIDVLRDHRRVGVCNYRYIQYYYECINGRFWFYYLGRDGFYERIANLDLPAWDIMFGDWYIVASNSFVDYNWDLFGRLLGLK